MNSHSLDGHSLESEPVSTIAQCCGIKEPFILCTVSFTTHKIQKCFSNPILTYKSGKYLFAKYGFENAGLYDVRASISSTQQSVIADALTSTAIIWSAATLDSAQTISGHHGANFYDEQKIVHTIANDYYQPYVQRAACLMSSRVQTIKKTSHFPFRLHFMKQKQPVYQIPLHLYPDTLS